jgi:hypothetical protein
MRFFTGLLKTYLPRLLGIGAGWATTKIAEKTGLIVDPASLNAAALAAYATVHRVVSSKVNPGDAATKELATAEKDAARTGTAVVPERKP